MCSFYVLAIDYFDEVVYNVGGHTVRHTTFYRRIFYMHEERIGLELCSLANLISRYIENLNNFQYAESITGTNSWIIAYIARNKDRDIFQRDLEKKFSVTRSTISKVVKLMEQKGLLERQSVPYDARLKKLVLTSKALALHHAIEDDIHNLEALLINGFKEEEVRKIVSYISRMKSNIINHNNQTVGFE